MNEIHDSTKSDEDYFNDDINDSHLYINTNDTLKDTKDLIVPSLRHILQYSDPIPEIKEEMTFLKFLNEILILRGPIESISVRRYYATDIITSIGPILKRNPDLKDIFKSALEKIDFKKIEDMKDLQKYTSQSKIIKELRKINKNGIQNAEYFFNISKLEGTPEFKRISSKGKLSNILDNYNNKLKILSKIDLKKCQLLKKIRKTTQIE